MDVDAPGKTTAKRNRDEDDNGSDTDSDEELKHFMTKTYSDSDSDDESFKFDEAEDDTDDDFSDESLSGNEEDVQKVQDRASQNKDNKRVNRWIIFFRVANFVSVLILTFHVN